MHLDFVRKTQLDILEATGVHIPRYFDESYLTYVMEKTEWEEFWAEQDCI